MRTARAGLPAPAAIEAPSATFLRRQGARQGHPDAVVARRQIAFALAVALAEFEQLAGTVHAQPLDRVARPAAAVAVARQPALGREHALAAMRGNVPLEIGLVAEQAEAVLDLPLDAGA